MDAQGPEREKLGREGLILEAATELLAREGISGLSMRAVARRAGLALGLVNYSGRLPNHMKSGGGGQPGVPTIGDAAARGG